MPRENVPRSFHQKTHGSRQTMSRRLVYPQLLQVNVISFLTSIAKSDLETESTLCTFLTKILQTYRRFSSRQADSFSRSATKGQIFSSHGNLIQQTKHALCVQIDSDSLSNAELGMLPVDAKTYHSTNIKHYIMLEKKNSGHQSMCPSRIAPKKRREEFTRFGQNPN